MKRDIRAAGNADSAAGRPANAADAFYERFRKVRFFSCLDGLRAMSIVAVIWHHSAASATVEEWGLLHRGNRGVTLFFAISAFLISTLLLRSKERDAIDVPRFWARRALRIFPLFYAVLALYVALVFFFESDAGVRTAFRGNLPAFATFTSNWFVELDDARVIFYFAWSLAAEEQFYLCWPWVERAFSKWWPVIVAIALLVLSQAAGLYLVSTGTTAIGLKIVSSVPAAIVLGVVLAHALNSRAVFRWIWAVLGRRGSAVLALVFAAVALSMETDLGFFGELLTSVGLTLVVAACVVREDNDFAPFLRIRALAWIGTVSYGVYLLHMLALGLARRGLAKFDLISPYGEFVLGTMIAIGVASVSFITFERFFLELKERWFGERSASVKNETTLEGPEPGGNVSTAREIRPASS